MIKGGIGFFDSGVGGLSVLSACLPACARYPVYYYGDNLNAPYGNKKKEELRSYVFSAFDLFADLDVLAVVVACNTVTALLIDELRAKYPFSVIGLEPAVLLAAKNGGQVFSLSTPGTHSSARYHSLLRRAKKRYPQSTITAIACDGLATAVEGLARGNEVCLEEYLPKGNPTSVVLGCTHYVHLKEEIAAFYGCKTYDGNVGVARRLSNVLKNRDCRPLCPKNRRLKPLLTTFPFNKIILRKIRRKLGCFRVKKGVRFRNVKNHLRLYFLGSGRFLNCQFYEQMFVFNKNGC